ASWLMPARLRPPVEAIYAFARGADDIADEGQLSDAARLHGAAPYPRARDERRGALAGPRAVPARARRDRIRWHAARGAVRPHRFRGARIPLAGPVAARPDRRLLPGRHHRALRELRGAAGLRAALGEPHRPVAAAPLRQDRR